MTEKRYSLVYYADKGGAFIKNNETDTEWYHDSRASLLEIVNELNKLAEKNQNLQFLIIEMLDFIKENDGVTRQEMSEWWNNKVMCE